MVKGQVYTGIIYLPHHPHADLHGQMRCVVRTSGITNLASCLRLYDIPFSPSLFNWGLWCESKSQVEIAVSATHYGEVLVCPTWCQYLKVEDYQPIPEKLKRGAVAKVLPTIPPAIPSGWSNYNPHLFHRWSGFSGPTRECEHCRNPKADPIHVGSVNE